MTLPTLLRRSWLFVALLVLPVTGQAAEYGKVVSISADSYSITYRANNVFTRNPKKFKAEALKLATKYCAEQGKQLKVIDETVSHPMLPPDNLTYTLIFKAVDAAEPVTAASPAAVVPPRAATPTDILYAEITKLDELRKKGLLTDAEFESEKQKVLSRSR